MPTHSFAVVDVETTGFSFRTTDRVIEVGVVVLDPGRGVTDRYATLVNPGRDVGRTDIHGIRAADLESAPTFAEIAGDLVERLADRVLVAHNARFDRDFIWAEFDRCGLPAPETAWICSMDIGAQLTGARSLAACREALGLDRAGAHEALADAEAAAAIVEHCLQTAAGREVLEDRLARAQVAPVRMWPTVGASGRCLSRIQARAPRVPTYISQLLARLPENAHLLESAHAAYLEVLDRALEDRHVSPDEAELLFEIADGWKIGRETVGSLHKSYVHSVADAAWADGVISEAERLDLEWVAGALGEAELLEELLRAPFVDGIATERHSSAGLEGRSVCFTGALLCTRRGYGITRTDAEALATKAGLVVQHNVTKKLDVLVVADPDTQSGKACRAREYGTRILAERMFWKGIGVDVD